MQAWLVYEVNDVCCADIPYCSTTDMEVFDTSEEAIAEMQRRKQKYIEEQDINNRKFLNEARLCVTFNDSLKRGIYEIRVMPIA